MEAAYQEYCQAENAGDHPCICYLNFLIFFANRSLAFKLPMSAIPHMLDRILGAENRDSVIRSFPQWIFSDQREGEDTVHPALKRHSRYDLSTQHIVSAVKWNGFVILAMMFGFDNCAIVSRRLSTVRTIPSSTSRSANSASFFISFYYNTTSRIRIIATKSIMRMQMSIHHDQTLAALPTLAPDVQLYEFNCHEFPLPSLFNRLNFYTDHERYNDSYVLQSRNPEQNKLFFKIYEIDLKDVVYASSSASYDYEMEGELYKVFLFVDERRVATYDPVRKRCRIGAFTPSIPLSTSFLRRHRVQLKFMMSGDSEDTDVVRLFYTTGYVRGEEEKREEDELVLAEPNVTLKMPEV